MYTGKRGRFCNIILILAFLVTGCEGNSQPVASGDSSRGGLEGIVVVQDDGSESGGDEAVYYTMEETALPDPDDAIKPQLEEGDWFRTGDLVLHGDSIYRYVVVFDQDRNWKDDYLQILRLSDRKWKEISPSVDFELAGKAYSSFGEPLFSGDGEIYSFVYQPEEYIFYLGRLGENGIEEILCPVPEDIRTQAGFINRIFAWDRSGNFYFYDGDKDVLNILDGHLQTQRRMTLEGTMLGIAQADSEADAYWYGVDADGDVTVRKIADNKILLDEFKRINASLGIMAEFSDSGTLFMADTRTIWRVDEEPQLIFDFIERGYIVNTLYGMERGENGEMRFLTKLDGEYTLLELKESNAPPAERQEIVLAFAMDHPALDQTIARFNRQNERYHISVMLPEENEDREAFRDRIQLEISAGRGPDILGHDVIPDIMPYVENNYLECLDGLLEDESRYLQAALEGCRIGGKLYGIPYDCTLEFVTYSEAAVGGRTSWTLPELMETVRVSGAKILQSGCDGLEIVKSYALYDNSNTTYIDWEKGESHLTEEAFLELLAFAREYADTGELQGEEGELIAAGDAFAVGVSMKEMHFLIGLNECFQGEPAIIGYPRENGNGIYVSSRELYLNVNSGCKEGAKEFLFYLMSEEEQIKYARFDNFDLIDLDHGSGFGSIQGHDSLFPVYMGAFDALVDSAGEASREEVYHTLFGVQYRDIPYTEKQVEQFYFLLEHAQPAKYNAFSITSIIDEELAPYFAGDITAEQAAQILDNRVQLYLDERGN